MLSLDMSTFVIIGGASGSGKQTVINKIIEKAPQLFQFWTTFTTRPPRENEIDGVDYDFITVGQFNELQDNGEIIVSMNWHGNYYGATVGSLEKVLRSGKIPIRDCGDYATVAEIKKRGYNAVSFFLDVDKSIVRERLTKRGGNIADIEQRLADYDKLVAMKEHFDYAIKNDDLDKCVSDIWSVLSKFDKRKC